MRVLFTSGSLHGHVNTLLPLAQAAQRVGHEVVFVTGPDFAAHVERAGLSCWPLPPSHELAGGNRQASWLDYFARTAAQRLAQLLPRARAWQPEIVVHEDTELAGAVVAAACGARHYVHGLGLMPPLAFVGWYGSALAALAAPHNVADVLRHVHEATYLEVCPPALRSEDERFWPRVQPLRPATGVPVAGDELPARITALPRRPTVLLTLGTVFNEAHDVLARALDGVRSLPVNVVVISGPNVDPARLGPQSPQVHVERWIPYALLLPHCAAVVSHGGAGGMFGALSHGLPQLVIPQGADQFANAAACVRAEAGLMLDAQRVSAGSVASRVHRLFEEPSFARAAGRVRDQIAQMPDAAAVAAAM